MESESKNSGNYKMKKIQLKNVNYKLSQKKIRVPGKLQSGEKAYHTGSM
jgi:hypothetical protein